VLHNYQIKQSILKILEPKEFINFLIDAEPYLIGYNSYNFDDPLINAFISGFRWNSYFHCSAAWNTGIVNCFKDDSILFQRL